MGKKSPKNSPQKPKGPSNKSSPASSEKKTSTQKRTEQQKLPVAPKKSEVCPDAVQSLVAPLDRLSVKAERSCDSQNMSIDSHVRNSDTQADDSASKLISATTPTTSSSGQDSSSQKFSPGEEEKSQSPIFWCLEEEMNTFMSLIDCVYFVSEHDKALATFDLIKSIITEDKSWTTPRELMDRLMTVYAEVGAKVPHDTTSRNVILRLRKIIFDEVREATKEFLPKPCKFAGQYFLRSMSSLNDVLNIDAVEMPQLPDHVDIARVTHDVKEGVLALMMEYEMELENIPAQIVNQAKKIIVEDDVVMTYAYCPIVAQLLISAARHCNYTLYVVESQPLCYGHLMLDDLRGNNVNVVLIPDCNAGALMAKMTKLIMPCNAVLSDGGIKTISFGGVLAHVAKLDGKQIYVVAANYQFTPSMVANVNVDLDPLQIDIDSSNCKAPFFLKKFDHTDCSDVTKLITNTGPLSPAQTPRAMADMYNPRQDNEEPLPIV